MTDTTSPSEPRSGSVIVPLRSDPPWLQVGLLVLTLVSIGLFALYFRFGVTPPKPALAIVPGLTLATFGGALLAWWGRARGSTMQLESAENRLELRVRKQREELIDRSKPFSAMLVLDSSSSQRVLVLSQRNDPVLVLDRTGSDSEVSSWSRRSVKLDLASVAISPESAHVLTVSNLGRLDGLLRSLETDLSDSTQLQLFSFPMPSGENLVVTPDSITIGDRTARVQPETIARKISISTAQGDVVALSIVDAETSFLLACQDSGETLDAANASDAPDGYLPAILWSVVAALFGVKSDALTTTSPVYRG